MAMPTEPQGLEPYDRVMENILEEAKVDQEQIEQLMTLVGVHESGGDASIHQRGGGPGRGLFQYELEEGGSGAGRTAMNRLYAALGGDLIAGKKPGDMPKWMDKYFSVNEWGHHEASGDVDFSELTADQQKILFLADKLMTPGAIKDIGKLADHEWWAKYHHKGANSNVQKFSNDSARYLKGEFRKFHNID